MQKVIFFNTEDQTDMAIEQEMAKGLDLELVLCNDRDNNDLVALCKDADAVITIYSPFTAEVLSSLPACKIVSLQAIGFNYIDVPAATRNGICVTNVPDFCVYDVAVHTTALVLALARHLVPLNGQVKSGKWGYAGHVMHRLQGKTFGAVAFGNIPRETARMLKTFGMEILAYDPFASDEVFKANGARRAETLDQLLAESDYVSVHSPLNDKTRNMIGAKEIARMKKTAYLLNTARGGIIDEAALHSALQNGVIAGAALDVLEKEGAHFASPLAALENCIFTPHIAFYSEESLIDMRIKAMERVIAVLCKKTPPPNLLNPDVLGNARFSN